MVMIFNIGEVKLGYEIGHVRHLETYIDVGFCIMSIIVIIYNGANLFPSYILR